jgi:hypothetical protein
MAEWATNDLPFTREGGWGMAGSEEAFVGAPGDARALSTGGGWLCHGGAGLVTSGIGTRANGFRGRLGKPAAATTSGTC